MKFYSLTDSSYGKILLLSNGGIALTGLYFSTHKIFQKIRENYLLKENLDIFADTTHQIEGYFKGNRQTFEVKYSFEGTHFQQKVWENLSKIRFGQTMSYKNIAYDIGNPAAVRAAASAIARNPLTLIIPCHRVIGTNGSLTGYAGGLDLKEKLLNFEQKNSLEKN